MLCSVTAPTVLVVNMKTWIQVWLSYCIHINTLCTCVVFSDSSGSAGGQYSVVVIGVSYSVRIITQYIVLYCRLLQLQQCWWSIWRVFHAVWTQHCCSGSATHPTSVSWNCPPLMSVLLLLTCLWLKLPPRCRQGHHTVSSAWTLVPTINH